MTKNFAYHVTSISHLENIKKEGIIPSKPEDFDDELGVYLFKSFGEVEGALSGWLGDRIDEWEEETGEEYSEIVLKINITGLEDTLIDTVGYEWFCPVKITLIDTVGYEWFCPVKIKPERIIDVFDPNEYHGE